MELWKDGFDHYGGDINQILNGAWGNFSAAVLGAPSYGARTGSYALKFNATGFARRGLGSAKSTVIVSMGATLDGLGVVQLTTLLDPASAAISTLSVNSDGSLTFTAGTTTILSQNQVIKSGTWHHVEAEYALGAQTVEVRVDGVTVLSGATVNYPEATATQVEISRSGGGSGFDFYVDDVIVRDDTGTRNNGFEGDLRVATLYPNADEAAQGWTPQPRKKFGAGILDNVDDPGAVTAANATALQLAAADYTIEMFARIHALPSVNNMGVLVSKWQADAAGNREYRLFLSGSGLATHDTLTLEISTDGQLGTVTQIFSWPFVPDLDRWYHIAVVRSAAEVSLFIDGKLQGTPFADPHTYFSGAGTFAIGASMTGTTAVDTTSQLTAFFDEVRITNGVARYNSDFAVPAAAFPRNAVGDPSFPQVALLCGFDSGILDESSFARTLTARNGSATFLVDDGDFAFQTINQPIPRDDTYIEADIVAASGVFQLDAQPSAGETVTLGAITYTFRAAVAAANDVLIGGTVTDSLNNLVAAIVAGVGSGVTYGTGTVANANATATKLPVNQISAAAIIAGATGNTIATTTTCAAGQWLQGATLTGGQDIPGPSEFAFERLAENTTILRSISLVHRAYKSDAGSADIKLSFVDVNGNVDAGTPHPLTVNPTYYEQVFDTDPSTGAGLTPLMLLGAKVRVERTD